MILTSKKPSWTMALLGLSLASGAALQASPPGATPPSLAPTVAIDLSQHPTEFAAALGPAVPDTDPPGVLTADRLPAVAKLAARLSRDRSWLKPDALRALAGRAVSLDELFEKAPRHVSLDGVLFRVKLEQVGKLWEGFEPATDPFLVFLTHEVYDGLGPDRALGYQDGEEMVIFAEDFERLPAVALTLVQLSQDETPRPEDRTVDLAAGRTRIPLGALRPQVAFRPGGLRLPEDSGPSVGLKSHCAPELAPTGCNGTNLLCPSGYSPFFILSGLRVTENHEGCCFAGDPEVELFPLRLDNTSPAGGTLNATTTWIFDGRQVQDPAGRIRSLPDVDDNSTFYSINLATFPSNIGQMFSGMLIEDDSEPGRLKMDNNKINVSQVLDTGQQIVQDIRGMQWLELIKDIFTLFDLLGFLSNDDDLYQPSLGVSNGLFCSSGLGQPFPRVFELSANEWGLRGYFACVNAACEDGGGGGGGGGGGEEPPPCGGEICPEEPIIN